MEPFTLLIKPSGSDCNLDCTYCFYKNRDPQLGHGQQRMGYDVLEKLIKDYMQLRFPLSGFAWQGGEPMLMGLDFYKKAVELQHKYSVPSQQLDNSLQTNAVLLDEKWCRFLAENNFLAGISIDGPKELHDYYRLDSGGNGTFERVVKGIECCKEYNADFNTMTLINNFNVNHPDEIFEFLVDIGAKYMQFIPCVEIDPKTNKIADFSVSPKQYGKFLCRVFDLWKKYGPEKLSIRDFDSILSFLIRGGHTVCTYSRQCAGYIAIEHTGDAFPCDFFIDSKWRLGNIAETNIAKLAADKAKSNFMQQKSQISNKCFSCQYLSLCWGGCLKDRFAFNKQNYSCNSYFCESYRMFFDYSVQSLIKIANQFKSGSLVRSQL